MKFLTRPECEAYFAKLGIDSDGLIAGSRGADRYKTLEAFYEPELADRMADFIATGQGRYVECLLWCAETVFNRGLEPNPPRAWLAFAEWRRAMGEPRDLYEAPGHLFAPEERDRLTKVVAFAIRWGWDAYVAAKPNKFVLRVCHDDYLTIYSRSTPSGLLDDLRKLGVTPKRAELRRR